MDCEALSGAVSTPARRIRSIWFEAAAGGLGEQTSALQGRERRSARFLEMTWAAPAGGGAASRGDDEAGASGQGLGGKLLEGSPDLRHLIEDRQPEARFVAEAERSERLLVLPSARVAVVFEKGFIEFSGERTPFHEIEFQLASGEPAAFHEFVAELARRLPIRLVSTSGMESAFLRMGGDRLAPVKASALALSRRAPLDEAICGILGGCLDQFVANWPALTLSSDPEAIHQMRVALRRLRAGVGLLRKAVSSPELETAASRAKELAKTLGGARDWDVFRDMLETGPLTGFDKEPSLYALLDAVERRRVDAHDSARALLRDPRTTQFVLELRSALARLAWRPGVPTAAPPSPSKEVAKRKKLDTARPGSARGFALRALDRLHRRALKRCRGFDSLSEADRHAARIGLKKARYAADFFESLFEKRKARAYLRALAGIQDDLGAYNDVIVAERLLQEIGGADGQGTTHAAGIVRGWYAHARQDMRKKAGGIEKSVGRLKPFWR